MRVEAILQCAHVPGQARARIGAGGEDEIGHPHLAIEIVASEWPAPLIGERELRQFAELWERDWAPRHQHRRNRDGQRQGGEQEPCGR